MRIGIVAGEASGDYLGAQLIEAVRARWPHVRFEGIAGPRMQAAGARTLFPMDALSVRGYVEVLRHLPRLLRMRAALARHFLQSPPALFIGVDAPDFNLGLAGRLKRAGIPAVQCVAPTVWAWRAGRLPGIRAAVSAVLAIFPFEPALFRRAGIACSTGSKQLEEGLEGVAWKKGTESTRGAAPSRPSAHPRPRLPADALVVALLPGSRNSELHYHADLFVETARRLTQRFPRIRFLVPLPTRTTYQRFDAAIWKANASDLPITLMHGHATEALTAADATLVASGTATLEAALCGCPMVVTYRLSALTARMVRRRKQLAYVSLPNILAGHWLVPELLQEEATADNLVRAMANLLTNASLREDLELRFRELHQALRTDTLRAIQQALAPWLGPDTAP